MTIAEIRQKFFEEMLKKLEESDEKAAKWYEGTEWWRKFKIGKR